MLKRIAPLVLAACLRLTAQQADVLYDEAKVPTFTLPDVLALRDGERAADAKSWSSRRRPEILALYETEVFGKSPAKPAKPNYQVKNVEKGALGGTADRKIVTVYLDGTPTGTKMDVLIYLPAGAKKAVPVFLGLSFAGVHTVANDPGVPLGPRWVRGVKEASPESSRGSAAQQWQVEKILAAGYGLATVDYNDIEPDFVGGMKYGIRPLFFQPGQSEPAAGEWGAIAAWAWAASRAMDYLEMDTVIDAGRVAIFGHSRLGKTALWAGARDTRFSMAIANESGEGGAAISRRNFGERTADLNAHFPHWFCGNFKKYSGREEEMPVDAHMLLALIAPRPLYVASAEGDQWSDPRGEFLAAVAAAPVWALFGKQGIGADQMPDNHQPIQHTVAYHIRAGKHNVTAYDWEQYLKFADAQWKPK